jgi:hypothetical protein
MSKVTKDLGLLNKLLKALFCFTRNINKTCTCGVDFLFLFLFQKVEARQLDNGDTRIHFKSVFFFIKIIFLPLLICKSFNKLNVRKIQKRNLNCVFYGFKNLFKLRIILSRFSMEDDELYTVLIVF